MIHFLRRASLLALLALAGVAATTPARADLIINGGFETADFTGWTVSGNANQGANADTFVFGNPHTGTYAAWLGAPNSDGFLSQDIATILGQKYDVSYFLAVDSNAGVATPNDFSASFGGQTLFSATNLAATDGHADPADDYTRYSFTALASGPTSALTFGFRDDPSEFRLDDVSVTPAPVPEASTTVCFGLLLALGGSGFAFARRKKAKA